VQRYIAVSKDLAQWLTKTVGVEPDRIRQIYNGVNPALFYPRQGARPDVAPPGFIPPNGKLIGTVGRLAVVKDQPTLVRAFAQVLRKRPQWRERLRLVMVGDGPLRPQVEACLHAEAMDSFVWLPGDREDVADLLRTLDLFVLPSLGEGISNTILEAMATGLPVIATRVGGNPELVDEGVTGALVPPADPAALADAVEAYVQDEAYMHQQGAAGHHKASRAFTWERCVEEYLGVYDELLGRSNA
jgi:sugar transferase (PEP-CTERM/EpsH1 system associated)